MKHDTVDPQGGEERSAKVHRLREEIGSVIEREYALLGKYREFAASFEALIPDEKLRHEAALQALSTTFKLSRQEIVEAFNRQQEELAVLEKAVGELFAAMGAKPFVGKQVREGQRAESAALQPAETRNSVKDCPMCGERITFDRKENKWHCYSCAYEELPGETAVAEQQQENPESPPAPPETEWQKRCPMCGGQMNFHVQDERWLCYTCAHEEMPADAVQGKSEGKRKQTSTSGPASAPSFAVPLASMVTDESRRPKKGTALSPSPSQLAARKKNCPVCHKKMDWHQHEKIWRCFFCDHKTRY
jgi:ribosomal protein L37AE/L43A